jgi:hypothetical protein
MKTATTNPCKLEVARQIILTLRADGPCSVDYIKADVLMQVPRATPENIDTAVSKVMKDLIKFKTIEKYESFDETDDSYVVSSRMYGKNGEWIGD